MKEDKVVIQPSVEEAQALVGLAIAGDSELESALEVLASQAKRKSGGKGSAFQKRMEPYLDHTVEIYAPRLEKAQAGKHPARMNFADGKTLRECAESTFFAWEDLKYDLVTMGYLKIVGCPEILSHHHEED